MPAEPLEIINGGVDTVADILWIAKPGSPLHSIKDLKGKRIGYTSPGSVTNMLILMALKVRGHERERREAGRRRRQSAPTSPAC